MKRMTAEEVQDKLFELLDEVEAGEEVSITKNGRVVARLDAGAVAGA